MVINGLVQQCCLNATLGDQPAEPVHKSINQELTAFFYSYRIIVPTLTLPN